MRSRPPIDRFMEKVDMSGRCWLWLGSVNHAGYGWFSVDGKQVRAHRWAYEHWVGQIPDGLGIDHLCRVKNCVNPEHLEPVTARVNNLRSTGRGATNARKTHCINGHAFTPENIYRAPGEPRSRVCRACVVEKNTRRRRRLAQARESQAGGDN